MKNNEIIRRNGLFALLLATSVLIPATPAKSVQADVVQENTQITASAESTTTENTSVDASTENTEESTAADAEAEAETEVLMGYATADDLNLREKATTNSESLKKLNAGDSMTILSEKGNWYKVESGETTGYVNKLYVSTEWIAFSNTVNLNLRKEPSKKAEVLDQFNQGDAMTVLEKDGSWYKVQYGDSVGYVKAKYIDFQCDVYIDGDNVNLRKAAHTESGIVKTLSTGKIVTLLEQNGSWYKVRSGKKIGYINASYISFTKPVIQVNTPASTGSSGSSSNTSNSGSSSSSGSNTSSSNNSSSGSNSSSGGSGSSSSSSSSLGQSVVNYAKQFLGNPYVYGGTSLTNGADCSGFVQSVYAHFGISLPRTSSAQRSAGYSVGSLSNAKPGDLICYDGHVGIYIGDNAIIHASNEKDGIKITYNAAYRKILSIRRVL